MLGGPAYSPKVGTKLDVPRLEGRTLPGQRLPLSRAIVGGFGPAAIGEMAVWSRLLDDAGQPFTSAFFQPSWTQAQEEQLGNCIPPSLHERTAIMLDPSDEWRGLIEPDKPSRAFAMILHPDDEEKALLLVVGPPTEEVWDLFLAVLRA